MTEEYLQEKPTDYLSEEELELLILQVEQAELVAAPPDLADRIVKMAEQSERPIMQMDRAERQAQKSAEFRRYCFRVMTSVAAAIVLLFTLPILTDSRDAFQAARPVGVQQRTIKSKEEVLSSRELFSDAWSGSRIFGSENQIHIFRNSDGGRKNETAEKE